MKRQRTDEGANIMMTDSENPELRHKVAPSPVVHVRGVRDYVSEVEIRDSLKTFGKISYVMNFPKKQMALVEFEDIESAKNLVEFASVKSLFINGKKAMFNFSTSQSINRPMDMKPSAVLLLLITNVQHPITVDVLHAACNPIGPVVRIVILRKFGVQAMVEFDSVATASRAKPLLDGADIYQSCCTIKAEFAKPEKLTVTRNDLDTWDFTVMNACEIAPLKSRPLLPSPFPSTDQFSGDQKPFDMFGQRPRMGEPNSMMMGGNDLYDMPRGMGGPRMMDAMSMGGKCPENPGCVLMVYGLCPEKMNCFKLFNLFCCYGNVAKVKFLKSKEGWAMVQMGDREACQKVIQYMNNITLYGNNIQISFSKQPMIQEVNNPYSLPDETPSYKDFTKSRNNRFMAPDSAIKNRICAPTDILYFFNAPPDLDEPTLCNVFRECNEPVPDKITMLKAVSDKSSRGVAYFENVNSATDALAGANNSRLKNPNGEKPYVIKFAYSAPPKNYSD